MKNKLLEETSSALDVIDEPSTEVLVLEQQSTEVLIPEQQIIQTLFGKYIKKSRICPVCMRHDHMEINRMRAVDHLLIGQIMDTKGLTRDVLDSHFSKHFIISKHNQDIIDLQEDSSQEANEIVRRALEGEIDLFGGAQAAKESKAQRLVGIRERIKELEDRISLNREEAESIDRQECIMYHKEAGNIENDIFKIEQALHKSVLPSSKEDLMRAFINFKLNSFSKFVDAIILILVEIEREHPEWTDIIQLIRLMLAPRITAIQADIMKSSGISNLSDEE